MSRDKTAADRQRRFRARRRERNGTVTPAIGGGHLVTVPEENIVHRDGHTYYTNAKGQVYGVVCCGVKGCPRCDSGEVKT